MIAVLASVHEVQLIKTGCSELLILFEKENHVPAYVQKLWKPTVSPKTQMTLTKQDLLRKPFLTNFSALITSSWSERFKIKMLCKSAWTNILILAVVTWGIYSNNALIFKCICDCGGSKTIRGCWWLWGIRFLLRLLPPLQSSEEKQARK